MSKLALFKSMFKSQKYKYLTEKGEYIGVREYSNYFINLYLVKDELCELWFFRPSNKLRIRRIYICRSILINFESVVILRLYKPTFIS